MGVTHNGQPPATLGPYRLLDRIGAGGMAEVYLALAFGASGFEKKVALKVLRPELRDNAKLLKLLIEEARLCARLQHHNLVQVHDLAVADGAYYMCMEYVDGADLQTLASRKRPGEALALLVVEEVAQALSYLHQAADDAGRPLGLVHRDVSPSNVLLSRAGEVKLSDLGIAKATKLAGMTQAKVLKGKYAYMSPEQVAGKTLGPSSDQFALGVTLLELLRGSRPFDGETPLSTMEAICEARPPELNDLDEDLRELVLRCLAQDPGQRYPDDEALRHGIAACRVRRPAAPADLARWVERCLDLEMPASVSVTAAAATEAAADAEAAAAAAADAAADAAAAAAADAAAAAEAAAAADSVADLERDKISCSFCDNDSTGDVCRRCGRPLCVFHLPGVWQRCQECESTWLLQRRSRPVDRYLWLLSALICVGLYIYFFPVLRAMPSTAGHRAITLGHPVLDAAVMATVASYFGGKLLVGVRRALARRGFLAEQEQQIDLSG